MNIFYVMVCIGAVAHIEQSVCGTEGNRERRLAERRTFDHCPNGSVRHDNSCYMISHLLANWPDALVYCDAYGAKLLTVESDAEQRFITGQLKTLGSGSADPKRYYWIGGTDAVSEGEWFWAKTVEPVQYTYWSPETQATTLTARTVWRFMETRDYGTTAIVTRNTALYVK